MLFTLLSLFLLQPPVEASKLVGLWQGDIELGAAKLGVHFTITEKDGKRTATMDVPEQSAKGIECAEPKLEGDKVTLDVPKIAGKFVGTFAKDGKSIVGTWSQSGSDFPLLLKSVEAFAVVKLNRPQLPKAPFPYTSTEVTFENKEANITLAGTLTLPPGDGPFTAVVLVSGSGPQDRDETLFDHKPFLVLADALSRNGVAVLRYDDRGVGKSKGTFAGATSADFATDAAAAVKFLATHAMINPKKIGIMGHSEGGLIGPIVAAKHPEAVGFLVLLAGPGLPGSEILLKQSYDIQKAAGAKDEDIDPLVALSKGMYEIIAKGGTKDDQKKALLALVSQPPKPLPETIIKQLKLDTDAGKEAMIAPVLEPWMNYFITFDPRPTLKQVKCPVLAVNGGVDLQVSPKENLEAIKKALNEGGNKNVTVEEFPKLNHLFQPSETGSVMEYGKIEITFDEEAIKKIVAWIKAR